MEIGDFAMYGSCKVRISSVKLRGIGAPYYRFFCVEDADHDHRTARTFGASPASITASSEWGDLTSYRLLRPVIAVGG